MEIIRTDRPDVFTLTGIHDGFLCGLHVEGDTELSLSFKTLEGQRWRLIVGNLIALKADNFRQGNIIFDVDFYNAASCPLEYLRCVFDYDEAEGERWLPARLKEMAAAPWFLMVLLNSYGCDLYALCRSAVSDVKIQKL